MANGVRRSRSGCRPALFWSAHRSWESRCGSVLVALITRVSHTFWPSKRSFTRPALGQAMELQHKTQGNDPAGGPTVPRTRCARLENKRYLPTQPYDRRRSAFLTVSARHQWCKSWTLHDSFRNTRLPLCVLVHNRSIVMLTSFDEGPANCEKCQNCSTCENQLPSIGQRPNVPIKDVGLADDLFSEVRKHFLQHKTSQSHVNTENINNTSVHNI